MKKRCPLSADDRFCNKDCAWFDQDQETCTVNLISKRLRDLVDTHQSELSTMNGSLGRITTVPR